MHASLLRQRILLALAGGVALAGCVEDPDDPISGGSGGAGASGPSGGAGGPSGGAGGDQDAGRGGAGGQREEMDADLPPDGDVSPPDQGPPPPDPEWPPLPETLSCPPDEGGEFQEAGPCCEEIACYSPEGAEACPEIRDDNQWEIAEALGYTGLGSGDCLCGVAGPYQPNDQGRCCYVISIQWCTGRPFNIDLDARTAAPARRDDWI